MNKKTKKKKSKILEIIIMIITLLVGGYFGIDSIINPYEPLPIEEYYLGCEDLTGVQLKNMLNEIIEKDFLAHNYSEAKVILADADVDPDDDTKVLTIYSRESVNRIWDSKSWHREHVWPNSRLGLERVAESEKNQASDLHNLRAIVPGINSSRSNKIFDAETDSDSYYPGDKDKGDVARILFYMVVMYPFLELVEEELPNDTDTNYLPEGAKMGKLSLLLKWHREDPVDDFERNRNEIIYNAQRNRNPFIDHPEFVHYIFEEDSSDQLTSNKEPQIYYYVILSKVRLKEDFI